jgi:6-pyruvoyltetrahydropterin/6-carboxytetrahydropterin synthase
METNKSMKQTITKRLEFDAAHSLENGYVGKCSNLHGHRYMLDVTVQLRNGQQLSDVGFVIDFSELKKVWSEKFEPIYDHAFLNETLGIQTTAENISLKLFKDMSKEINNERIFVSSIRLYETPTSYSEINALESEL